VPEGFAMSGEMKAKTLAELPLLPLEAIVAIWWD
jgi:hypothetical protein